jgi:hypothetical protein
MLEHGSVRRRALKRLRPHALNAERAPAIDQRVKKYVFPSAARRPHITHDRAGRLSCGTYSDFYASARSAWFL